MAHTLRRTSERECGVVHVGGLCNLTAGLCTLHRLREYVKWGGALVAIQV